MLQRHEVAQELGTTCAATLAKELLACLSSGCWPSVCGLQMLTPVIFLFPDTLSTLCQVLHTQLGS